MKGKVYIPSIPTRWDEATESRVPSVDLNPAAKFGDLVSMSNGIGTLEDQITQVTVSSSYVTADDCILCVGDVVLAAVAIAAVSLAHDTPINLLRWDKKAKRYNQVEVRL